VFDLYLITPDLPPDQILAQTEALLLAAPPARLAVQLRAALLPELERRAVAHALRALTRRRSIALLVNADLSLALEVEADGVQLPERGPTIEQARAMLGARALIGASRHDLDGVRSAALAGASFATLSPVFAVPGKGEPLGLARFAEIACASGLPLLGLGGITAELAPSVMRAGACGVAIIRQLFESEQPERALRAVLAAIDLGRQAPSGRPDERT
jgi:thiamine-phosphate pyrophosphorylase